MRSLLFLFIGLLPLTVSAQQTRRTPEGFSWVTPGSEKLVASISKKIRHRTFQSKSMGIPVGYYIYLPPGYYQQEKEK